MRGHCDVIVFVVCVIATICVQQACSQMASVPSTGKAGEAMNFAMDLFNQHSQLDTISAAWEVYSNTGEVLTEPNQAPVNIYRLYGVIVTPTICANTAENRAALVTQCPPLDPLVSGSSRYCKFKVRETTSGATSTFSMVYQMCWP